jgi:hypothetical protein
MSKIIEEFERKVVAMIIDDLINAGFILEIEDNREEAYRIKDSSKETLDEIFGYGEYVPSGSDNIYVYIENGEVPHGWVRIVFDNGEYIISDYTVNLDEYLARPIAFCKEYE